MSKRTAIEKPSWCNVRIGLKNRPDKDAIELDMLPVDVLNLIVEPLQRGEKFMCGDDLIDPNNISEIQITEAKYRFSDKIGTFIKPSYSEKWRWSTQGKDVTDNFIKLPKQKKSKSKFLPLSNNVFIVHGRDYSPMKELKAMLKEFGLNPIVLHEQPSGSRTIVEKLEKYSDVGYAFVILTPDDVGGSSRDRRMLRFEGKERARQNVILEFGFFMGLLGRDKVCCLYKGDVELPSDMHGIVYIPFKDSVREARDMIIKELKEAGYEIKM